MTRLRTLTAKGTSASTRWWLLTVTAVATVIAALFFALPSGGVAQTVLFLSAAVTPAALVAVRLSRTRRLTLWPWTMLLGASALYAVATLFWSLTPLATGRDLPFPSALDGLYFASYTLAAAFLVGVLYRRHRDADEARRGAAVALIDAAILAVAMMALLWPVLVGPHLADPQIAGLAQAVMIGYPLLTAIVVGLVARVAMSGTPWTPAPWLLVAWAGGELASDTFYGFLSATGDFYYGHPISLGWLVSYVALGALALHPGLFRLAEGNIATNVLGARLWLPLGAVLLPLGVSLFDQSLLLDMLVIVSVVLVLVRVRLMSGDLAEQRRLAADLAVLSQRFEHQSLHDGLTGLANRPLFNAQLEHEWVHQRRHGRGLILLVVDLDGFKLVNDRHGHHAGDALLVDAARRMQRCVRDSDTLARLGGDEFGIILPETGLTDAREVAQRLQRELTAPLDVGDGPQRLSASIGIAEIHERQQDPEDLLREADAAMYAAKAGGKARHQIYVAGLEVVPDFRLSDVVPREAIAWANYIRRLRTEIAQAKLSGEISPTSRAPERVHRTLQKVLAAIDELAPDAPTVTLDLPPRLDLDEFVFQGTAVHHWADALIARGILTAVRPPEADRFWEHLERGTVLATDQGSDLACYAGER